MPAAFMKTYLPTSWPACRMPAGLCTCPLSMTIAAFCTLNVRCHSHLHQLSAFLPMQPLQHQCAAASAACAWADVMFASGTHDQSLYDGCCPQHRDMLGDRRLLVLQPIPMQLRVRHLAQMAAHTEASAQARGPSCFGLVQAGCPEQWDVGCEACRALI